MAETPGHHPEASLCHGNEAASVQQHHAPPRPIDRNLRVGLGSQYKKIPTWDKKTLGWKPDPATACHGRQHSAGAVALGRQEKEGSGFEASVAVATPS